MSGLRLHKEPQNANRQFAHLAANSTFDMYDPVRLSSQQLADCVLTTDTGLLQNGVVGFAVERAEGMTPGWIATSAANGFGAVTNQKRSYIPWDAPGIEFRTRNYWTTAGTQIAKAGTLIGTIAWLSPAGGVQNWGVDASSVTVGDAGEENATDGAAIFIIAVLDSQMLPILPSATLTAGDGWLVFKPVGRSQNRSGGV